MPGSAGSGAPARSWRKRPSPAHGGGAGGPTRRVPPPAPGPHHPPGARRARRPRSSTSTSPGTHATAWSRCARALAVAPISSAAFSQSVTETCPSRNDTRGARTLPLAASSCSMASASGLPGRSWPPAFTSNSTATRQRGHGSIVQLRYTGWHPSSHRLIAGDGRGDRRARTVLRARSDGRLGSGVSAPAVRPCRRVGRPRAAAWAAPAGAARGRGRAPRRCARRPAGTSAPR